MASDKLTLEAQKVLDDLWAKGQLPFQLKADRVESLGSEEYIVRFYDSRIRSVDVSWKNSESFKDAVQVAVMARVTRLTRAVGKWRMNMCIAVAFLEALW
jgi:hypothetical protein